MSKITQFLNLGVRKMLMGKLGEECSCSGESSFWFCFVCLFMTRPFVIIYKPWRRVTKAVQRIPTVLHSNSPLVHILLISCHTTVFGVCSLKPVFTGNLIQA